MSVSLRLRSLQKAAVLSSRRVSLAGSRALHATSRRSEFYSDTSLATFDKITGTPDRLVLVDFYADWCRPCHQLSPILEKVSTDASLKSGSGLPIDVVKMDVENEEIRPLAAQLRITSLPTVIAFSNGKPVSKFVGALSEEQVKLHLQGL